MSFCILRRSDIKDAMIFLIAEPPVQRAIHQHAVPGGPRSRPGCERIMACSRGDSLTAGGREAEWVATRGSPQASRRCPEPRSRGIARLPRAERRGASYTLLPDIGLVNPGASQGLRPPLLSAVPRRTRGPRAPGVASSQTFRTGGSVHEPTRGRLRGVSRDCPFACASGARADTSCRPTSRLSTRP